MNYKSLSKTAIFLPIIFIGSCASLPLSLDPTLSEDQKEKIHVERQFFAKYPGLPPSQIERVGQSPDDSIPPALPYYTPDSNPKAIFPTLEGRPWTREIGMHIPRADESREARAEWCKTAISEIIVRYYRSDAGAAMWLGSPGESGRRSGNYMIEQSILGNLRVCLWIGYAHVDSNTRARAAVSILEQAKRQEGQRLQVASQYYAEVAQQLGVIFGN